MAVCDFEYQIKPLLFMQTALESVLLSDLISGLAKTPVFGFIIAIVGCHFGLTTRGGTEGVGQSTTRTVVVVSISILVADYFLTRIFVAFLPA
jgi:phospholipid/cholesterol/gamma-HCH transport system permease protein